MLLLFVKVSSGRKLFAWHSVMFTHCILHSAQCTNFTFSVQASAFLALYNFITLFTLLIALTILTAMLRSIRNSQFYLNKNFVLSIFACFSFLHTVLHANKCTKRTRIRYTLIYRIWCSYGWLFYHVSSVLAFIHAGSFRGKFTKDIYNTI